MKKYNTTDLSPDSAFERHVFHRDQFAHFLRWSHILNEAKIGETIVDFGCGQANLLEVLYRNRFKCKKYVGIDIRKQTIDTAKQKFSMVDWAEFYAQDLIFPTIDLDFKADKVCSFEVAEHVSKHNIDAFLQNFKKCGKESAIYYLSTPNNDGTCASNHTYDGGDGRGVVCQEFEYNELKSYIEKYFVIEKTYGTFASIKDYKHLLNEWQTKMFDALKDYYDTNLLSVIMAPFFPEQSRNIMWVLKNK